MTATTTLKDRLRSDLTTAIKERDEARSATLRMALAAITYEEVAGSVARSLSEAETVTVLTREVKKRKEAAEAFAGAGRDERAARERAEGEVLAHYLPAQLTDDELNSLVAATVAETGAVGLKSMGMVMKAVAPKIAGRAEGGRVAAAVKAALA
jgi:uncharacterized protein YqeY